jgi:hypothetical protein
MKEKIKYLVLAFFTILVVGIGYIVFIKSFNGNTKIVLLNEGKGYTSFDDIIKRPEFKNKIVYVDVWGANCAACFEDFENYTPMLTAHYKNAKDIAFLYICIDRRRLPEIRWKRKIKEFHPDGYHILVKGGDEEHKLAIDVAGEAADGKYFPYEPCYFIVNKKGEITKRPTLDLNKQELKPVDKKFLYDKLDSLRKL